MAGQRFKRALKVALAAFVVLVLFLLFERIRGQISLARYKSSLIAQGEKLAAKDLALSFNAEDNGAPGIYQAIAELKEGAVLPKHWPPRMAATPSGRAIVGFQEDVWVDEKVTNDWAGAAADLKTNETQLAQIRAGLEKPVLCNNVDLSQGSSMSFAHLAPVKSVCQWFGTAGQLSLHEGRTPEAATNLISGIETTRLLADDRIIISELVRIAIASVSRGFTWEALQTEGWADADLARLQSAWNGQGFAAPMARSMEGERVFMDASYDLLRKSNEQTAQSFYFTLELAELGFPDRPAWEEKLRKLPGGAAVADFLKIQVYCRVWRFAWSHQAQRRSLVQMQRLIEITRNAAKGKSYAEIEPSINRLISDTERRNWYAKLRFPEPQSAQTLANTIKRAMRMETDRSMVLCAIALKRFSLREGKPPATLDDLVPQFLASVPVDYMDGKPMKYRLNPDGSFTLYSVGQNGKDDHGDTSLPEEKKDSRVLWNRLDYAWPLPALPDEVTAWREEMSKH